MLTCVSCNLYMWHCAFICVMFCLHVLCDIDMGWLRSVGSIKLWVSFAQYCLFYRSLLQKRPIILSVLLTVGTPYVVMGLAMFVRECVQHIIPWYLVTQCWSLVRYTWYSITNMCGTSIHICGETSPQRICVVRRIHLWIMVRRIHRCGETYCYLGRTSGLYIWVVHLVRTSHLSWDVRPIHICGETYWYVWWDVFIGVARRIDMCGETYWCVVKRETYSYLWRKTYSYVSWHMYDDICAMRFMYLCDMAHLCVWHDEFVPYLWRDVFICET